MLFWGDVVKGLEYHCEKSPLLVLSGYSSFLPLLTKRNLCIKRYLQSYHVLSFISIFFGGFFVLKEQT